MQTSTTSNSTSTQPANQFHVLQIDQTLGVGESFNTWESFREAVVGRYGTEDILECELTDIEINEQGYLVIGGTQYVLSPLGAKAFAKILKPLTITDDIPAFAVRSTLENVRLIVNKQVKVVIQRHTNIILNVVMAGKKHQDYIEEVLSFFDGLDDSKYKFFSAQVSEIGYQINFLFDDVQGKNSFEIGNSHYAIGKTVYGDIYRIRPSVDIHTLIINMDNGDYSTMGEYVMYKHSLNNKMEINKLKITSEKFLNGNEKKGIPPFKDALKDAWLIFSYSRAKDIEEMIDFASKTDISLWKFFDLRNKLSKLFDNTDQIDELIGGIDETQLEFLKQQKKDLQAMTRLSGLDRILKTTPALIIDKHGNKSGLNAKVIFDTLVNFQNTCGMSEFVAINSIAMSVLVDTFNHTLRQ